VRWDWEAGLREFDRGLARFLRMPMVWAAAAMYFLADLLPHLPDPIAKKIMDKFLAALGLGD